MHCTLCGTPGTSFTRAVHPRHGTVYLCDACRQREQASLRPAGRGCACNPDTLR